MFIRSLILALTHLLALVLGVGLIDSDSREIKFIR